MVSYQPIVLAGETDVNGENPAAVPLCSPNTLEIVLRLRSETGDRLFEIRQGVMSEI